MSTEELSTKFERLMVSQSTLISSVSELMGTLNTVATQQLNLIKRMHDYGETLVRHEKMLARCYGCGNFRGKDPNEETDEIPAYDPRGTGPLVALKQPIPKQ